MIFRLEQLRFLLDKNIIDKEKYNRLILFFENYSNDINSFSEEDKKLAKKENAKGNFDILSDKDLLNAKRQGIITPQEFIEIFSFFIKKPFDENKNEIKKDKIFFSQDDLLLACDKGIISSETYSELINFFKELKNNKKVNTIPKKNLNKTQENVPDNRYTFEKLLYYFGGFFCNFCYVLVYGKHHYIYRQKRGACSRFIVFYDI